jgi:hypothetical protein
MKHAWIEPLARTRTLVYVPQVQYEKQADVNQL